jgi:hypothetical protein
MKSEQRIRALIRLGLILNKVQTSDYETYILDSLSQSEGFAFQSLKDACLQSTHRNPWFTVDSVYHAIEGISKMLSEEALNNWVSDYSLINVSPKKVAVILAGNIPAVGFHDFLCVLISGHHFLGKLSSSDSVLLPAISNLLIAIEPAFEPRITFMEGMICGFDAVIATGSNNSSRYFDYYFGKYPNIIRSNRNSIAVLTGNETEIQLKALAEDVFSYFGLGCRNVSLLFVPYSYDFSPMLDVFSKRFDATLYSKYMNNYEYNKALFLINQTPHFDNGSVLLRQDAGFNTPVSVLHYQYYSGLDSVLSSIEINKALIQCVVSDSEHIERSIPFGQTQYPSALDYADGLDTMEFLLSI